ncbi:MFS transporter [Streptomyces sp. NPDC002537]
MPEPTPPSPRHTSAAERAPLPEVPDRSLPGIALVLALGAFAALLDSTVVGVAVDTLATSFSAGLSATQWVCTAYLLALAAVTPVAGRCARRFGARNVWIAALCVFLAGTLLCGLTRFSLGALIAFRVLQGIGGGMLFPLMRIIVAEVAGRERLGRMMALVSVPAQAAPVLGPVAGGAVAQHLSWHWVFLLNVPVLVAAIALSAALLPRRRGSVRTGAMTSGLLRDRAFTMSSALSFLNNVGLFAAVLLVPLFFQQVTGAGALHAGLVLACQGLGMSAAVLFFGRFAGTRRDPRTVVATGLALVAAGTVPFALAGPGASVPLLAAALFVRGIGTAFAIAPTTTTLYRTLPGSKFAGATTANAMVQQVGSAAGVAVTAVLLQCFTGASGVTDGFRWAFGAVLAFAALAVVPALFLPAEDVRRA